MKTGIKKITVDEDGDVTFYFRDTGDQPFDISEFEMGSFTSEGLFDIIASIRAFDAIKCLQEEKEIYFNRLVELGDTSENKNTTPHIAWYCKACGGITTETEIPVTMCGYCNSKRIKSYKSEE